MATSLAAVRAATRSRPPLPHAPEPPRRARHEAADRERPPTHPAHERPPPAPQGPAINATTTSAKPHQLAAPGPDTAIHPAQRALSFGAGVQSTALLSLSADATLPEVDVALFAEVVDGSSPWACRGEQPEPVREDFGLAV